MIPLWVVIALVVAAYILGLASFVPEVPAEILDHVPANFPTTNGSAWST